MRVKTLVAAGMIALALSGACASADDDASPNTKSFLEAYAGADDVGKILGESYVIGITNGIAVSNMVLKNRKQELIFCQPEDASLDVKQVILAIAMSVDKTPKLGTLPLPVAVAAELEAMWPCKAEQSL